MNLTPEQEELGRRNFLKTLAGTPALVAMGAAAALKGPVRGGPVRVGFIGVGVQGRAVLGQVDPAFADVRALCDINPDSLAKADEVLAKKNLHPARHYVDWKDMLQKEDLEAIITAPPLWMHAEIVTGCLGAGKHVLCEKMMAWDEAGCQAMLEAARKSGRVLEIGYQRFYSPLYQAAYDGVIRPGVLGDVYHVRLVWHRNANWRRTGQPPSPDYDPSRWGYPTFEHLLNWRLYWRYSKGLFAELASHQVSATNWFLDSAPKSVVSSGGVYRFKDREVYDHVYATFEYPGGPTAVFSAIESNAFDHYYEMYLGTKGTLIIRAETDAFLFGEGQASGATTIDVAAKGAGPAVETTETKPTGAPTVTSTSQRFERSSSTRNEIATFCSAIRAGKPLACGPERAMKSARSCIRANEAVQKATRLDV